MSLSSPSGQLVSVHRNTSFLRGCNPIEESKLKLGSIKGVYCSSMGEPMRDQDFKYRKPRIYSDSESFYPSPHHLAPTAPMIISSGSIIPATSRSVSGDEGSEHGQDSKPARTVSDSPLNRKRKLSWPRSGAEPQTYESGSKSGGEERDIQMNPLSNSSTRAGSERLPGIAHLDEQMDTPWSVGHARRAAGFRGSVGEDSIRRLTSQTFAHSGRSFRSSISSTGRSDMPITSLSHSPRMMGAFRRPSSPHYSSYDNEHSRLQSSYQSNTERFSHSSNASPSMAPNSAIARQSPFDSENTASYRRRHSEWTGDRSSSLAPPLPSMSSSFHEDRRQAPHYHDSREDHYHRSPSRPERQGHREDKPEYPQYRYSSQHREPDTTMTSSRSSFQYDPSPQQSSSEQHGVSHRHRLYDRESPSFYEDSQRIDTSSPHAAHRFSSSGGNTSPSVPRRRGKLPKAVTDLLKAWLLDHASHPYPTEDEKRRLCSVTGLSISQVSNWFINARRRILVPQGSGNFALGQTASGLPLPTGHGHASRSPPSPPSHHAPSAHHQLHHHSSSQYHAIHPEDSKHHLYQSGSNSQSPEQRSRRSFDEAQ